MSRNVTQHIVAEAYGLRKLLRFQKDLIWQSALGLFKNPGIEEWSCTVEDLRDGYRDILIQVGPADAGLILTAERQKATIVTDDGGLAHCAGVRSVPAVLLHQLGIP
jgi:predicted DNA-binding protein (UPF0278 family)